MNASIGNMLLEVYKRYELVKKPAARDRGQHLFLNFINGCHTSCYQSSGKVVGPEFESPIRRLPTLTSRAFTCEDGVINEPSRPPGKGVQGHG